MEPKLREIMGGILDVDPSSFHDDFGPSDAARWDSLNALRMVTAFEEAFSVRFTMDEIAKMTTYGAIRESIAAKGVA